jgi:hypothetical protein
MREVHVPRRDLFNGAVQRTRVCQFTGRTAGRVSNNAVEQTVWDRAIFAIVTGTVLALGACTEAPTAGDGNPAGGWPQHATAVRYALGVGGGDCPPDVAFYHSRGSTNTIELGVVASPGETVSYSVESNDPAYDGRRDQALIAAGDNGHTFAIGVPISAVVSVSVSASGRADERGGTCMAAAL